MNIGIVILNYNTFNLTKNIIKKCAEMDIFKKIIVVDNNSKEKIPDMLEEYQNVDIIKLDENLGYARGNNIGFKKLDEYGIQYGFLANPDVEFDVNTIKCLVNFLDNNKEYCVISSIRGDNSYEDDALQFWNLPNMAECYLESFYVYRRFNYKKRRIKSVNILKNNKSSFIEVEVVPGAFFAVDLNKFKKVGFLDEHTFLWYEENCLAQKVKKNGYKEAILKEAYYYHNHGSKVHGNKLFFRYNLSKEYYFREYITKNKFANFILKILDSYSNFEQSILNIVGKKIKRRLK